MTVLTKGELVDIIAEKKAITKKDATAYIEDAFATLGEVLTEYGAGFKFGDIGTFDVVTVAEREHRNPQTGDAIVKPEHLALKFKVNKRTKDALSSLPVE